MIDLEKLDVKVEVQELEGGAWKVMLSWQPASAGPRQHITNRVVRFSREEAEERGLEWLAAVKAADARMRGETA